MGAVEGERVRPGLPDFPMIQVNFRHGFNPSPRPSKKNTKDDQTCVLSA